MFDIDKYLRTEDAAKFLGVTNQSIYNMIHDNVFNTVRLENSRGWGGKRAYEIRMDELNRIKAAREKYGRKWKTYIMVIEEQPDIESNPKMEELIKLFSVLKMVSARQNELIGKIQTLMEEMI